MANERDKDLGALLALMVHDLRNPAATIGANLTFLRETVGENADDPEVGSAFDDVSSAVLELKRGLDQLAWIGRWLAGDAAAPLADGEINTAMRAAARAVGEDGIVIEPLPQPTRARGAGTASRILEILLLNAKAHGGGKPIVLRAKQGPDGTVAIEVEDEGPAINPELASVAFSIAGQQRLKGRPDGRYSRAAGLLAAGVLAENLDVRLDAGRNGERAVFRVTLACI